MAALNDPELLHILQFTNDRNEQHKLFVIAEKTWVMGEAGFEFYVDDEDSEHLLITTKRIASGPSYDGHNGTYIFGGDRATVYLADPFPYYESQRQQSELFWFWPVGVSRFAVQELPKEDYEFLAPAYAALSDSARERSYINVFRHKASVA